MVRKQRATKKLDCSRKQELVSSKLGYDLLPFQMCDIVHNRNRLIDNAVAGNCERLNER